MERGKVVFRLFLSFEFAVILIFLQSEDSQRNGTTIRAQGTFKNVNFGPKTEEMDE